MKILRIVSSGFEEGGVENGIVLMQPIFEKLGHEVRIMASDRRMDLPRFDDYRFDSKNSNIVSTFAYYTFNSRSYRLLKKILNEYKPDIVQLHTMAEISPSVLFLLRKIPTVLTVHGPEVFTKSLMLWYMPKQDFKNFSFLIEDLTFFGKVRYFYYKYVITVLYKIGLQNVDAVVTLSHYMQKLIANDGIQNIYIPNGAVLLDKKPLPNNKQIAYSGRLEKFKGVDYLLRAMPQILKKEPEVQLVIAGNGSYRSDLESLVKDLKIESNVRFLGHISKEKIHEVYENSIMLVLPSIWPEAFGKVGIEAMSVGRPVVATDVGGVTDWLIDGDNGYLVSSKDASAIVEAVLKILENPFNLLQMSQSARKKSEEFTLEKHVEKMIRLYEEVIAKYKKI